MIADGAISSSHATRVATPTRSSAARHAPVFAAPKVRRDSANSSLHLSLWRLKADRLSVANPFATSRLHVTEIDVRCRPALNAETASRPDSSVSARRTAQVRPACESNSAACITCGLCRVKAGIARANRESALPPDGFQRMLDEFAVAFRLQKQGDTRTLQ